VEHNGQETLIPLLLVSILAFIIPILTSWFSKTSNIQVPAVVGEIICGIIIGHSFLGLISHTDNIQWLEFLSLFGFTYLMFLSGLEIDFGLMASESNVNRIALVKRKIMNQPLVQAGLYFAITLFLSSIVAGVLYYYHLINSWAMMLLILSTTSVSVVVPIIKEKGLAKTRLGQTILISALMADFLTMILITLVVAFHRESTGSSTFVIIILLALLVFVLYKLHVSRTFDGLIKKLYVIRPFISELSHATTQLKVRGAIALMVTFIVMSQMLGFEVILGAFLAGLLTTLLLGEAKTQQLEMKLDAIGYGFFIPIFFISVGIDMDLNVFFASEKAWVVLVFLVISAFLIKIVPALVFRYSYTFRESLSAGVLLSARLSLIIAASTIGLKQGLISEEVNAAIVMVAVITCIASPILFNRLYDTKPTENREKLSIIGAGYMGRVLAEQLLEHKQDIILTALEKKEYEDAKIRGLPVVYCGKNINETLLNSKITEMKTVILTTPHDDYNLSVCLAARNTFGIRNLMSLVNNPENVELFREQNIEPVSKVFATVGSIVNRLIAPDAFAMFSGQEEEIRIVEVWLTNPAFDNIALNTIQLPGDTLVVHIKRGREGIVPHGSTIIYLNDHLTLAGNPTFIKECVDLLGIPPDQYCPVEKSS
jgi:Kef-type K+ transport system membrane component KefB/Trk K+ transport system NAD-binding subunit